MKRTFLYSVFFIALALFQTSFLAHIFVFSFVPNVFFLLFFLFLLFLRSDSFHWVIPALIGGFVLDMYSTHFIGFWVLILLASGFILQFIRQRYVVVPSFLRNV